MTLPGTDVEGKPSKMFVEILKQAFRRIFAITQGVMERSFHMKS
jgi:hypothetical protein